MLWLVLISLLITSHAIAGIDPDPDGIGVYFDVDAETVSVTNSAMCYVILTNQSQSNLDRVRFSFYTRAYGSWTKFWSGDTIQTQCYLNSESITYDQNGGIPHQFYFDMVPKPEFMGNVSNRILVSFRMSAHDIDSPCRFYLYNSMYHGNGAWHTLTPSSGDPLIPVAEINGSGPVLVESTLFGSIKAMFR